MILNVENIYYAWITGYFLGSLLMLLSGAIFVLIILYVERTQREWRARIDKSRNSRY